MFTLAICTYNRSKILEICLSSIYNSPADTALFKVLVIDNNSTDDTAKLVENFISQHDNLSRVVEKKQGIAAARNRAVRECNTEYICFLDDDAKISGEYISRVQEVIENHAPDLFGGPIYPYYLDHKPDWFKDEYEIRIHAKRSGWMGSGFLSGSNLIIHRSVFSDAGYFDEQYGPHGEALYYGEETDLIQRARAAGKSVYYDLELVVYHLVPAYKMQVLYFILANYLSGKSQYKITKSENSPSLRNLLELIDLPFEDLNTIIKKKPGEVERLFVERVANDFQVLGQLSESFRDKLSGQVNMDELEMIRHHKRKNKPITGRQYLATIYHSTRLFLKGLFHDKNKF